MNQNPSSDGKESAFIFFLVLGLLTASDRVFRLSNSGDDIPSSQTLLRALSTFELLSLSAGLPVTCVKFVRPFDYLLSNKIGTRQAFLK